ncbi:hypothetical protein [Litorivivens sp.]|uniref:hypothetical protein n=1 Tax=Litorivivens sp. TaxID=2020868 RepID=UPI0035658C91
MLDVGHSGYVERPFQMFYFGFSFALLGDLLFLYASKKLGKKKSPVSAPFRFPAMLDQHRSLRNSTFAAVAAAGLEQCSLCSSVVLRFSAPSKGGLSDEFVAA